MKTTICLIAVSLLIDSRLRATPELKEELKTVCGDYKTTVDAALSPINRQHALELEALLKRAQDANDKQTALETLVELRKLGPAATQYVAKASFEFSPPKEINADEVLGIHRVGDPFCTITPVRNTGLYELTVTAADPQFAATRANDLVHALQTGIAAKGNYPLIKIWERAEPPTHPITRASSSTQ